MDIDNLTLGQIKEITAMIGNSSAPTLNQHVGEKVIIRTYSAGVWFGLLDKKSGNEVILINARRMWRWQCVRSISLSAVAVYGIDTDKSKIAPAVSNVWLEAIEIISCADFAISNIEGCKNAESQ